jgi:hypothetical protein
MTPSDSTPAGNPERPRCPMTTDADSDAIGEAALRYAWHGWPIIPGTRPATPRMRGWPTPLAQALPYRSPISTNDVTRYWHHHDHPILLATGLTIDVLAARHRTAPRCYNGSDRTARSRSTPTDSGCSSSRPASRSPTNCCAAKCTTTVPATGYHSRQPASANTT